MYKGFDAVQLAIKTAEQPDSMIYKDRKKYNKFYEAAERYASKHGIIIIGDIGIKMLLYQELDLQDNQYILISKNADKDAKNIAKLLYDIDPDGLGKYIYAMPKEKDLLYDIWVNNRLMFQIKSLVSNRGVDTFKLIMPASRPGMYAKDATGMVSLNVYDSELQLINVYSKLTDPSMVGEYVNLVRYEPILRKEFAATIKQKINQSTVKHGGGDKPCTISTKQIVEMLLEKFVFRTGHVLIGEYGLEKSTKFMSGKRLQIITSNSIKDEQIYIKKLIDDLGCQSHSGINNPNIPMDNELRRMTFYIERKQGRRESIIDVYNAGSYSLIPHINNIGTLPVIMKFILVDFWTIQLLYRMETTSKGYTIKLLTNLYDTFKHASVKYTKLFELGKFDKLFPTNTSNYIGYYTDVLVNFRRRLMYTKTGNTVPFYPCSV
jgi:hypothetical protein